MPDLFATYRECREDGCRMEAEKRKQRCYECRLRTLPPVVKSDAAQRRLSLIPEVARRKTIPAKEWPPGRRWCAGCQTFILVEDCTGSRCKACVSIGSHASRIKSTFGVESDTYVWLLKIQGGKCAICRVRPKTTRFSLDHDHNHCKSGCGKCIRGLLCSRCNHELLGAAHDSVNILRNAVQYLETPPMSGEWEIPQYERQKWAEENPDDPVDVAPF